MTPILGGGSLGIQAVAPTSRLPGATGWASHGKGMLRVSAPPPAFLALPGMGVLGDLLEKPWEALPGPRMQEQPRGQRIPLGAGGDGCWEGQFPAGLGTWQLQLLPPGKAWLQQPPVCLCFSSEHDGPLYLLAHGHSHTPISI